MTLQEAIKLLEMDLGVTKDRALWAASSFNLLAEIRGNLPPTGQMRQYSEDADLFGKMGEALEIVLEAVKGYKP
jgi:hypothetical protein